MKKIFNLFIIFVLIFFAIAIIGNAESVISTVKYSFQIWINNLFPALFPFFIISELLVNYGFVEILSNLFKPLFNKIFKINSATAFIFFMSLLSGLPSNSKYARQLYLENKIDEHEASKILMFSHFANPLFILGTIGITFLNDKHLGYIVMISHYLGNIIIGLIFRNFHKSNANCNIEHINHKPLGLIMSESITHAIDTLLLVLGVTTTFLVITAIIFNNIDMPIYLKTFISGILEMTQGLKYVSDLNILNKYKAVIITAIISFGGLSVHLQTLSIISDTKIKYLPFLISRIIHSIISSIICYILV